MLAPKPAAVTFEEASAVSTVYVTVDLALWRAGGGGNKLRAHDKVTGEVLHEFILPANQSGVPMTYEVNGKQYIVVAVGARGSPGELVALTVD